MLNQLTRLSIEADGRYASDQEMQFLDNFFESVDLRVRCYEKIRDEEEKILDRTKAKMMTENSEIFARGSKDLSSIWRRDVMIILRCTGAAMLINDLDWLRDSILLWHRTIVNANKTQHISLATYNLMPEVLKECLTEEELGLILPILQLNQSILSY